MLEFFRRYQRGFFIAVTVVIVISFSFFGTFDAFMRSAPEDKVVFTAVDGTKVCRSELNDMVAFLSSDNHDQQFLNVLWGGNSLNDGVIANDFLSTGLAQVVAAPYLKELTEELQFRLEKEKRFVPYSNPKVPFISAEQVWAYFAPELKENFYALRKCSNAAELDPFTVRVKLYLSERKFPGIYLKQLLKYQEGQHSWIDPDDNLTHQDLSLFGYHSAQDWFGRAFIELCSEYIINAAKIAESKGFSVSRDETLSALYRNAEQSFKDASKNPYLGISTVGEYFHEQLRRLGIDQGRAIRVWHNVLLFRKLFYSRADSVLVDGLGFKDLYKSLNEYADVEILALPNEYHFSKMADVEKFEVYLNAVRATAPGPVKGAKYLEIPTQFQTVQEIKKVYPELVKRVFVLRHASLDKETLQTKVGVRNTWDWQLKDPNWKKLQEKFPEIAQQKALTSEERLQVLDSLNPTTRSQVDSYSREQIIDEHPEWISQALDEVPVKEETVELREKGGIYPFAGIANRFALVQLLEAAPLGKQDDSLASYSQDGRHYHKIEVVQRSDDEKIVPFAQASQDGTLNELYDKVLECSYERIRSQHPAKYLKENGEWKPLAEVKELVANGYFNDLHDSLNIVVDQEKQKMPYFCDWSAVEQAKVACRMLPFMKSIAHAAKAQPDAYQDYIETEAASTASEYKPLQTKLVLTKERIVRKDENSRISAKDALHLPLDGWSSLHFYPIEGIVFFKVTGKGILSSVEMERSKALEAKAMLGQEVVCFLGKDLLIEMQKKDAIVLEKQGENP